MAVSILIAFWSVSILFIITPGVDWAYVISAGLNGKGIVPAVTGLLFGHFLATIIVAAGVGALVASYPVALAAITVIGAAYLLWIGFNLLFHPPAPHTNEVQQANSSVYWVAKGVCVSGLNPKVFLLFLALLPQFTDPTSAWPVPIQILCLGLIHIFSCGIIYLLVGFGSNAVLKTRPEAALWMGRCSGGAMIVIAILLIAGDL